MLFGNKKFIVMFTLNSTGKRNYGASELYIEYGDTSSIEDLRETFTWTSDIGDARTFNSKEEAQRFVSMLQRIGDRTWQSSIERIDYIPVRN